VEFFLRSAFVQIAKKNFYVLHLDRCNTPTTMHTGKKFGFFEVLLWTRRDIYLLLLIATVPTVCYAWLDMKWITLPWLPIALLGTAVAFVVGFKNNASYDRMWEARKAWGAIVNASRSWALMTRDYITNKHAAVPLSKAELNAIHHRMANRHFAWLTALRHQLREARTWEAVYKKHNQEYKDKWFKVHEHHHHVEKELSHYLSAAELQEVMQVHNKAAYIMGLQSAELARLLEAGYIEDFRHMELEKMIVEFLNQQGVCERIKNFPYPRQYATLNLYFIKIFVFLIPFGMLKEFEELGNCMIWLNIPFSALSAWIFTTLEKIGESTESPFEGSANDIPITTMSRAIEIDVRELLHMGDVPETLQPQHQILL
jgi:ion channel-forming bestrophin family protein